MRKSRFTESQIVGILKQGETGIPIAEILRQHNISKATYFHWRAKYAGASVDELKRLKELVAIAAQIQASYANVTARATLTVQPSVIAGIAQRIALFPSPVTAGGHTTATVTLAAAV